MWRFPNTASYLSPVLSPKSHPQTKVTDAQSHVPRTPFLPDGDGCARRAGLSQRILDVSVEWSEYTGFFDGFEVGTILLPFMPAYVSRCSPLRAIRVVGRFCYASATCCAILQLPSPGAY